MDRPEYSRVGSTEECMAEPRHLYSLSELVCDTCGTRWQVGQVNRDTYGQENIAPRTGHSYVRGLSYKGGIDSRNEPFEGEQYLCNHSSLHGVIIYYRSERDQDDPVPNGHL